MEKIAGDAITVGSLSVAIDFASIGYWVLDQEIFLAV